MSKKIVNSEQIAQLPGSIVIQAPKLSRELEAERVRKQAEKYSGPTADELRANAQEFKNSWHIEKETILAQAHSKAEEIVEEAQKRANELLDNKITETEKLQQDSINAITLMQERSEQDARDLQEKISRELEEMKDLRKKEGFEEGFQEGMSVGKEESQRIIEQLHVILNKVVERRSNMVDELENQILNLILAISRKVVKALSSEQRSVVINNVVYALRKLRKKSDVTIRVNLTNLQTISKRVNDISSLAENIENVTVVEDTTVDPGGCVVETDFGEIDARISSQLEAIERNIRQLMPVQGTEK